MTETEKLAYLAGIIDGEGTITINSSMQHKRKTIQYKPRVVVSNTEKSLLNWLQEEFGGSVTFYTSPKKATHRERYLWRVISLQHIKELLSGCLPFLIIKKEKAILLLQYIEIRLSSIEEKGRNAKYGDAEIEIYDKISRLNYLGSKIGNTNVGGAE